MPTTSSIREIKKYPNRRLYDTEVSSYITLEDVKKLVLNNINFRVVDARTQEDLTNNTLLQIITELEQKGAPIFTTALLQQIIHFYGNNLQSSLTQFLEQSMSFFKDHTSSNYLQDLSTQQMQFWQTMQKHWQELFKK